MKKVVLKKVLCITLAASMLASLFVMPASAEAIELPDWEILLDPVYEMNFSPDSDGKFYDSPVGTEGRQEVVRIDNPEGMAQLPFDSENVDNKILSSGEGSRIYTGKATSALYSAYSKGTARGDLNTGASGAVDDYCLKLVDNDVDVSGTADTTIMFPETYGATSDNSHKYRFEMDWKWQGFTTVSGGGYGLRDEGTPGGTTLFTFYIGGKAVALTAKADNEATDARGSAAMYFHSSDFGMYASTQLTDAADVSNVTPSAEKFTEAESGKWIHVTVDFDFTNGTIYAVLEGETEKREISTQIVRGNDVFANGISGISMYGSKKSIRRINFIDNVKLSPISVPRVSLSAGEVLGENAYLMDFSPDNDGKFYDSPAGTEGRQELARISNPTDMIQLPSDGGNVDDKVISSDATGRIYSNMVTQYSYIALSKGQTAGDLNAGASGAVDDYCLKQVDAAYGDNQAGGTFAQTVITFPKTYGGADDNSHKYRFEIDWKWQSYRTSGGNYIVDTTEEPQSIKGANIVEFRIGDAAVYLRGDYTTGNLCFYEADSSSNTTFGLTPTTQNSKQSDLTGIVTAAPRFTEAEQGKWIHITIDFDFENGTIVATLEGETEKREISTEILSGEEEFKKGISGIKLQGSAKNKRKINFIDNVSLTPIMTKDPAIKAVGNKLMWKAITGAASYNVYSSQAADGAKEAVTVKKLDTTSEPGYVIATIDYADDAAKYYTVTAVSDNKGESNNSNALLMSAQNIISDVDFEITSAAESLATAKVSVNVDAAKGFEKEIKLIAAVYDSDMLVDIVESELISFIKGSEDTIVVTLNNLSTAPTNNMCMKFFLWDEDINPIKGAEGLSAAEWEVALANYNN